MPETRHIVKDDKGAFKALYKNYYQPLLHLSTYYLKDDDEAENVVQEAFENYGSWELGLTGMPTFRIFFLRLLKTIASIY